MKKLITALMLGWSGVALAQTSPQPPPVSSPQGEHAGYSRDDPYIRCAKNHPTDRARYSNCDLNGVWHPLGQNPS